MTANAKNQNAFTPDIEGTTARFQEAGERVYDASRKVTGAYLDGVERYVTGLTQIERKLGEQTQLEPFATLLGAHAKLTDDVTKASLTAARELIAA
ncbi:MAG: hypothetical protein ACRDMJ_08260 [Solirubrobacteraceae bacterium]